jgi:hypothetical protein
MKTQDSKVVLTACDADGTVMQELVLAPYEWYDGECPLIDSDEERRRLSVRTIEGYQANSEGKIIQRWKNTYDADGRLEDSEERLDDSKPSTPPPPPGQSAYDQLVRMGVCKEKA